MFSLINAALIAGWLVLALTLLLRGGGKKDKAEGYWRQEEERINSRASQAGVSWGSRETKLIWLFSLGVACGLYFLTGNLLLFGAGWLLMLILPSLIIDSRRRQQRLASLTALTDCLRQLLARLPDQGSLSRALEMVLESSGDRESTLIMGQVLDELRLGSSVREAIGLWQNKVGLKKFDHVAETMIQANKDGWTPAALSALDKSVQALEADLRAVLLAAQKSVSKKRQLYTTLLTSWSFPVILSLMNTGQKNIYLHTLAGKILIFAYVAFSLYVVVKGQEYLSLNVEEL
ncbi:MAG: type II secretion system F family protein [Peptococcaceae bacterium]|jgi:Flp pilus assembly protein TadB|nr:type II secretion system F family protein [Peptococcaceae bacterium]